MSAVYNLLRRQYRRGKIDENDLQEAVNRGLITEDEKAEIEAVKEED